MEKNHAKLYMAKHGKHSRYKIDKVESISWSQWGQGPARSLKVIHWQPSWEPKSLLEIHDDYKSLRDAYLQSVSQQSPQAPAATYVQRDTHLTEPQRQGIGMDPSPRTNEFLPNYDSSLITIVTQSCNPELDIKPTGTYTITTPTIHSEILELHDPLGRHISNITTTTAKSLHARFIHATMPFVNTSTAMKHFNEAMARLLHGHNTMQSTAEELKVHNLQEINPPSLLSCLQLHMQLEGEVFAHPATCHPSFKYHCTSHQHGKDFGLSQNAYSHEWRRVMATPNYESTEMDKAIRWAIASTLATESPVVACLNLPHWRTTAYCKWLTHPNVHFVTRIPKEEYICPAYGHWQGREVTTYTPKWDINIIVVANNAGLRTIHKEALCAGLKQLYPSCTCMPANILIRNTPALASLTFQPPRRFSKAGPPPGTMDTAEPATSNEGGQLVPRSGALRAYTRDVFYTDGSSIRYEDGRGTVCGSGTYHALSGQAIALDPKGIAETNTNNRAELAAIYYTTQTFQPTLLIEKQTSDDNLIIATDSMLSLYLINSGVKRPHTLRMSKHRELALAIADIVASRACAGKRTTLLKVKAHSALSGNDKADEMAKHAVAAIACGCNLPTVLVGQLARENQHWVQHTSTLPDGTVSVSNLSDLDSSLTRVLHKNDRCRLGSSNTSATYFSLLHEARPHLCTIVNDITQSLQGIGYPAWRAAIRYRMGLTWSAKLARRYRTQGMAHDGLCPLCGEIDGGTHIMLECRHLKPYHIARHDAAVVILAKSLLKSSHGNSYLVSDVQSQKIININDRSQLTGRKNKRNAPLEPQTSFPTSPYNDSEVDSNTCANPTDASTQPPVDTSFLLNIPKRIPSWLVSTGARPDLLMVDGLPHNFSISHRLCAGTPPKGIRRIHVIELGYCNLSAWQEKLEQKLNQHDTGNNLKPDLVESLSRTYGARAGDMVQMHAMPLAVCGLALQCNLDTLRQMGLEKHQAMRCMRKLSLSAMKYMHTIVRERHKLCAPGTRVPTSEWRDPGLGRYARHLPCAPPAGSGKAGG